MNPKFTDAYDI